MLYKTCIIKFGIKSSITPRKKKLLQCKVLNPFCLFRPAVLEQTIVSVSNSLPFNASAAAECSFHSLLPGPANTKQPEARAA